MFLFFSDDTNFVSQPQTALKHPDQEIKYVTREGYCRTYCAGSSSCAAYSYNHETSTCYLSSRASVVQIGPGDDKQTFVKKSFFRHLKINGQITEPTSSHSYNNYRRYCNTGSYYRLRIRFRIKFRIRDRFRIRIRNRFRL